MTLDDHAGMPEFVIAIDPGRDKCGLALVRADGQVIYRAVVPAISIADAVSTLLESQPGAAVVIGNRTGATSVSAAIAACCRAGVPMPAIRMIDEHQSTLQGRRRYFQDNPPRGWRRLLPIGLQTPPRPYDDYVAVILAERYLASLHRG